MRRSADKRVKIIINADDLGISPEVNESIFGLIGGKHVTSATLIANAPEIYHAARSIGRFPSCSFGAHLNLSEFAPLSREGASLLAQGGAMSRELIEQVSPQPRILHAIFTEFSAQISRLLALGVPITHLDSHQHIHTLPSVFPALKAVQARFCIRKLRNTRNIYLPEHAISQALSMKKKLYGVALRNLYRSTTPDGLTDLPTLLKLNAQQARRFGSLEVMVHPGARGQEADEATLQTSWMESLPFASEPSSYHRL